MTNKPGEQSTSSQVAKPPPPYTASPSQPTTQPNYPIIQPYPIQQQPIYVRSGERPCTRFCRAFFVAVVIWLLSGIFIRSFLSLVHWRPHHHHRPGSYAVPSDLTLSACVTGFAWSLEPFSPTSYAAQYPPGHSFLPPSAFPYSSQRTFELPLNNQRGEGNIFLLSRGPMSSGTLDVVVDPEQKKGVASVRVTVRYFREDVRDGAKACLVEREGGVSGVGVFTPEWWYTGPGVDKQLYMEITIVLPSDSADESTPLYIKRFETDLPNTLHRLGDLAKTISFGSITLQGTNAAIQVESVRMDQGSFVTKNGGIQGTFNASTSLELKTSNAPIRVDVGLHSGGGTGDTPFEMSTSNGPIDASIHLIPSTSPSPPHYKIQAHTSNSRLNLKFPPLSLPPPFSPILSLSARTSNAPATVSLYPTYEGRFSLQTTNHGVEVHENKQGGRSKRRVVMQRPGRGAGRGRVEGFVELVGVGHEEEGGKKGGRVDVRSQNALVLLEL
ncbi:uncharacterized protein LACBIDRAFT_298291 [Laccaria bicolor S238N-H82]|uniref:Predicted protein n=1 Tax=Laccaria bicolor (strain S238N-H82 / ATCC MYA-4686) TaxID=486041 RepID=B0DCP3_LACBS|nr:uncharacterized protein LACBIDRAFT_298291 [Laccaria bicolor S238N-H82]EDR07765.1 predicted protein [Laccaria bicolor S238N-H82]|eukprot:XP_001881554.1 predicted protein [Laccaria bicolor S238N-H82]